MELRTKTENTIIRSLSQNSGRRGATNTTATNHSEYGVHHGDEENSTENKDNEKARGKAGF
jgi:hypothetical protein